MRYRDVPDGIDRETYVPQVGDYVTCYIAVYDTVVRIEDDGRRLVFGDESSLRTEHCDLVRPASTLTPALA